MKYILSLVFLIILTGCSSKQYFEPKKTQGDYKGETIYVNENISSFNKSGATLKNGLFISKSGISTKKLENGFYFLNQENKKTISTNYEDSIFINEELFKLDLSIVAGSVKENLAALISSDNALILYNLNTKKIEYKNYLKESVINDERITNPLFFNELIIFPSLDGKLVIVNYKTKKLINEILVDPVGKFNNISFLSVVNDTLIASTAHKIISIKSSNTIIKDYEVRDIIATKNHIYFATIDGTIIKTDVSLEPIFQKKFKYAKIFTLMFKEKLYALESQGFLIELSKNLTQEKIYNFYFINEKISFSQNNRLYYGADLHTNYIEIK